MSEQSFIDFLKAFENINQSQQSFVVATLTYTIGGAPQNIGSRMIVNNQGLVWGTVGGGKIENYIIQKSILFLSETVQPDSKTKSKNPNLNIEVNLQLDIGMSCGGKIHVLLEKFNSHTNWNVAIFGAGHVGQALVSCLSNCCVQLSVIDFRDEWLNKISEQTRVKKILANSANEMSTILSKLPSNTFVVLVTMGHATDYPILECAINQFSFPYVGVMGSKIKAQKLKSELKQSLRFPPNQIEEKINSYFCPIGEDFGNNSPAEIAISISAQLLIQRQKILGW